MVGKLSKIIDIRPMIKPTIFLEDGFSLNINIEINTVNNRAPPLAIG